MGMAPGYRLEKTAQAGKTADAAEDVKHRDGGREEAGVERRGAAVRGDAVERVLEEEVRREFSGLPVYVGMGGYAKRTAPMDERQFRRYLETCRRFGFRFDRRGRGGSSRWRSCSHLQRKPASNSTQTPTGRTPLMDRLAEAVAAHLCRHRASACSDSHSTLRGVGSPR